MRRRAVECTDAEGRQAPDTCTSSPPHQVGLGWEQHVHRVPGGGVPPGAVPAPAPPPGGAPGDGGWRGRLGGRGVDHLLHHLWGGHKDQGGQVPWRQVTL